MKKQLLTILMIGLAVCFAGCTDEATDEGGEAAPAEEPMAPAEDAAAAPAAAVEEAGDAAAVTMAKLDGVDVEAGCGKCEYGLVDACALAIKVDGKAYLVDGTDIISDEVGLCGATRPAKVTGEVTDDTHFMAKVFEFTDGK